MGRKDRRSRKRRVAEDTGPDQGRQGAVMLLRCLGVGSLFALVAVVRPSSPAGKGDARMPAWIFEPGHTAAAFCVRHMMVTWVRGHLKDVHGSLEFDPENPATLSVQATIDARN